MDLSTVTGLLSALIFPVFAINYLVQNYLDNQTWWRNIPQSRQSLYELLAALLISVVAYVALHLLPDVPTTWLTQINALYPILYAIVSAWLGGQIGHQVFVRGARNMARIDAEVAKIAQNMKTLLPNG